MERKIKTNGYFYCEGECGFKSKKISTLSYFKGKKLCRHCRNKQSKAVCNLPKLNISESSLRHIKLSPEELESIKPKKLDFTKVEIDNKFSVSLTKDEYNFFKRQLMNQGLTSYEAHEKIGQLIEVIKSNHKMFKKKEINFSEEFNKLI